MLQGGLGIDLSPAGVEFARDFGALGKTQLFQTLKRVLNLVSIEAIGDAGNQTRARSGIAFTEDHVDPGEEFGGLCFVVGQVTNGLLFFRGFRAWRRCGWANCT